MKPTTPMSLLRISLSAAALFTTGCGSTSITQRKTDRLVAYERLAPELQTAVDRGEILEGMDTNAVFIAWGKPTRVESTPTSTGAELRWEYWRKWTRLHPHWSIEPGPGGYYATAEFRPTTSSWEYRSAWVVFREGVVIRSGRFPPPAY